MTLRGFAAALLLATYVFPTAALGGLRVLRSGPFRTRMLNAPVMPRQKSGMGPRGGSVAASAAPALIDCSQSAMQFFENMRTPAALIAGAALSTLWVQLGDRERDYPVYQTAYSFLIAASVALEMSVVFMSTTMTTHMLSRPYKSAMAVDTVSFLIREFEFPYVAMRLQFFTGLLSMVGGLALRSYVAFDHVDALRRSMVALLFATACKMIAFFNTTLGVGHYATLPALCLRFVQLMFFEENKMIIWKHPMDMLATFLVGVSFVYFLRGVLLGAQRKYRELFQSK